MKESGAKVIDVDGSYIYRKTQMASAPLRDAVLPDVPLIGWEGVDVTVRSNHVDKIPKVTHGKLKYM